MNNISKQELVTMRIEKHIRDTLKALAKKEHRTMVAQLEFMMAKEEAIHE